ncbi:hypothetical protein Glove_16g105 [Diversispora epigaea]|uniref:Uncharacterized protein n=1 Tax=Diversispora epigaea TaxID=1348612 RepID=A0A397JWW1_9GLOM|nr:hypothetical protein Glove_16g105 [Diversispora epigaea]
MSVNFKCLYCDHYLSSRNAYSQHVKYCNELKELNISTEEFNNDISDTVSSINEMSLNSDDFSQIEELQSIREENLLPVFEISYQYESDSNYADDVSLCSEEFENFDEILSKSLQNYTKKSNTNMSNNLEEFEPKSLTLQDNIEESEVEIKEFPNEAYADLMTLVTKHNLSNKAGNSIIKFFNRHSDLSQSPLPKNIETDSQELKINVKYKFKSSEKLKQVLMGTPANLLAMASSGSVQDESTLVLPLDVSPPKATFPHCQPPQVKYAEASIPSSACILSFILYSDATTTDTLEKIRETFHKSLKFLLDPLFENENGIDYKINNRIIWFFPKISTIIGDWPEACTYSLTYKSASSNFPCHFCLVQKNDLIDTMQDQIILRNHENMMKHFNNNTDHSVTTVPDRMHHLDLSLYHYQIEFTKEILGRSSIDKMNERIGAIPRYPEGD